MGDGLKKILLSGVESITYTCEKTFKMINSLMDKRDFTIRNGNEFYQELKRSATKKVPEIKDTETFMNKSACITREEFEELKNRLDKIEAILKNKQSNH